ARPHVRPHHHRDRAPPVDHPGHGQDPRPAQGPAAGNGHAPGTPGPARVVLQAVSTPIQGSRREGYEGGEGYEGTHEGAVGFAELAISRLILVRGSCDVLASDCTDHGDCRGFLAVTGLASSIRMLIDDGNWGFDARGHWDRHRASQEVRTESEGKRLPAAVRHRPQSRWTPGRVRAKSGSGARRREDPEPVSS